jgi:hypothetical protein
MRSAAYDDPDLTGEDIWRPRTTSSLTTDASMEGWGGWIGEIGDPNSQARGYWPVWVQDLCRAGIWYIGELELLAVIYCLQAFKDRLTGTHIHLHIDNQLVMWAINKRTTRRRVMQPLLGDLQALCKELKASIFGDATYINTKDNWLADGLSRYTDRSDWELVVDFFQACEQSWGPHTFDRFATSLNAKCAKFNSRWWDPLTSGLDGLGQDWSGHNNWANPPWDLLDRVLAKVDDQTSLTLVAPYWRAQSWWPVLRAKAKAVYLLPGSASKFIQGQSGEPFRSPHWQVVVARFQPTPLSSASEPSASWVRLQ